MNGIKVGILSVVMLLSVIAAPPAVADSSITTESIPTFIALILV